MQGEAREYEGDRERLSLLESQLKQLLGALISVADMVGVTRRATQTLRKIRVVNMLKLTIYFT